MSKKRLAIIFVFIYLVTVAVVIKNVPGIGMNGTNLAAMCLGNSLPSMEIIEQDATEASTKTAVTKETEEEPVVKKVKKKTGKPQVLIVHTHATESYLPATEGNYHTTKEKNTVRDAGNVLEASLEEEGVGVVHDKTLHDNPSYDSSYSRSYETILALLKKYPTIECVIDLHRDATPQKIAGPVTKVDGKNAAVYSYVISNTTPTYKENKAFLNKLNNIANAGFDGYTANILERPYWYNQEIQRKSILIEMGNNRNNIEDVRRCAKIFGKMLAKAL